MQPQSNKWHRKLNARFNNLQQYYIAHQIIQTQAVRITIILQYWHRETQRICQAHCTNNNLLQRPLS